MKKLILASKSPRRKELLQKLGLVFEVIPSNIEEQLDTTLSVEEQVKKISFQKAQAVAKKVNGTNALILAADTMIVVKSEILGKPKDADDAFKILKRLSGTSHYVITAFTILDTENNKTITDYTKTTVWFRSLKDEEIHKFIDREQPYDKAGAYAIQGLASLFVEKIEGDYFGIIGLSVYKVSQALSQFEVAIFK